MSLWKRIFGRDFEEYVDLGEDLLKSGQLGQARLEFENALSRRKGVADARITYVREKITEARNGLARGHFDDGKLCLEDEEYERAIECFETAIEVAASEELRTEIQSFVNNIDANSARVAFEDAKDMTEVERFQVLTGAWEDERADELESYGESFRVAFLQLHDGKAKEATEAMQAILEEHGNALYLHLELGLALRGAEKLEEASKELKGFLEQLAEEEEELRRIHRERREEEEEDVEDGEEEGEDEEEIVLTPDAQVQAHATLADISLELKEVDAAETELRALVDLLPEKSGPYVHLGTFLREQERFEEAMDVLEAGQEFMGSMRPDMRVIRELGLTQRALGKLDEAIESLKAVVDYQAAMDDYNFDPTTAVPLAEIYEENEKPERAADLYRHLAAGSYAAVHFLCNERAGRLLMENKKHDLARRYLSRALELAVKEEEKTRVKEMIDQLDE